MDLKKYSPGQITIRRIGNSYIVCISSTPLKICKNKKTAENLADKLRIKYGRRPKRKK